MYHKVKPPHSFLPTEKHHEQNGRHIDILQLHTLFDMLAFKIFPKLVTGAVIELIRVQAYHPEGQEFES